MERQIVHVDMDAFYASVEQRDDPTLRGRPVVVAWRGSRSVVCAASYEARKYGIRSAMPAITAERLCAEAVFIPPDFTRYRAVSQAVRSIFRRHTELIEPLSLDEAYLNVSHRPSGLQVAAEIRASIKEELDLTSSAGIAPNKFLAKIASDWQKPNGLFEIRREDALNFLFPLAVGSIPGVGKVTEQRLHKLGLKTVGDLRSAGAFRLETWFGRGGGRLYRLACGQDESPVVPDRPTKSISAEDTFAKDVPLEETIPTIRLLAERVWKAAAEEPRQARTVVLKLKTGDFNIITRSHTPGAPIASGGQLMEIALALPERVLLDRKTLYRLVGVGLGNFEDAVAESEQPALF